MDENRNNNKIIKFYNDLMNLTEIDIYKNGQIENKELLINIDNRKQIVNLCISNLKQSNNILKNYSSLIYIYKNFGNENELIEYIKDLFKIFKNDFQNYIEKLKKIKEEQTQTNNKIVIDSLPHKIHIDIRIKFLELISKKMSNNLEIFEFLKENILLTEKIFDAEDKIHFLDFINKINNKKNEIEIINELLLKIENNNKKIFIDNEDIIFYKYLFLELNYKENNLQFKLKFENQLNKHINFEITTINKEVNKLNHYKNLIDLFYIQNKNECINEMAEFLFKLHIYNNNINNLCELNKHLLINKEKLNSIYLYKYIIEETENESYSKKKSHKFLCKKRIFRIIIKNNKKQNKEKEENSFYFFGNTKINEIHNFLRKKYPDDYFSFNLVINKEYKTFNESDFNKTLNELKEQKIQLKINIKEIVKDKLFENNKLTNSFSNLLEVWFKMYSKNNEVMDKNGLSQFISKVTRKYFSPETIKILRYFKKYAYDYTHYLLNKEEFINIYYKQLKEKGKIDVVYNNIKNMNYYPDLTEINKAEIPKEEDNLNIRFNLSNNENDNKNNNIYLFDELVQKYNKTLNNEIFDFILFLSTNINIYNNVLNNFNNNENMKFTKKLNDHIDNMYNLYIIKSIFEDIKVIELKNNEQYKNLQICSEKYLPFDSEDNNNKKQQFVIDFIKNNYLVLIEYLSITLQNINNDEKNKKGKKEIIIRLCLKGFEIINNIYNTYYKIIFEKESEDIILLNSPINIIKDNNLEKYLENHDNYKNIINNIIDFLSLHYLKYNSYEKDYNLIKLMERCFELLLSLLYTNNYIYEKNCNSRQSKESLKNIIKNVLIINKNEKNKDFIRKLYFFNHKENKIPLKFLDFLIEETFSIFEEENNDFELAKYKKLFYMYFNNLCSYSIKNNYEKIKSKLIYIFTKIFNYIRIKDINIEEGKDSLISNNLQILIACIDKIKKENYDKIKNEIITAKIKDENTLYLLIMDKFMEEEDKKIERKKKDNDDIKRLVNEEISNKFIPYEEVIKMKNNKEENKKKEQNMGEKKLINSMIEYCAWYLSLEDNNDKINKIILELNDNKKLDDENGDILKIINKKSLKKRKEYVGLKNNGNICYLNTVIQQLFMIPQFRYLILNIDDKKEKIKNELIDDNNILHQLQRMFTYLLFSSYAEYNPRDFFISFKGEMETGQQDCQEFYSNLCDKLEEHLKNNTNQKDLINNFFYGKICTINKCSSCGYIKYGSDKFTSLSLDVENINNIYESLNKYISTDNIEDYSCEKCNKKVTLEKRALLSDLPNILVIHLKRINMNFNEDKIEKINSRFEFPKILNLKNYCIENILNKEDEKSEIYKKKDEYYEYELKGINVHMGNAEGGHYISIIKVDKENKNDNEEKDKWYKFNDSKVKEFDINNIEKECFGSNEDKNEEIHQSAYLLFYELSKKKPIKIIVNENEIQNNEKIISINKVNEGKYNITKLNNNINERELSKAIFYNEEENNYYKIIPYNKIPKNIPKEYLYEVINDNKIYDYITGNNRIISFNNYLIQVLIKFFELESFDIIKYNFDFEIYKILVDILLNGIYSCISQDINNDKNIKNIVIILKKIIIPMIKEKTNFNDEQKLQLIDFINKNLFNNYIIKLIFTNSNIKEIQDQFYDLIKLIIKINNEEKNTKLFNNIYNIINGDNKISVHLYEILNVFIQNGGNEKNAIQISKEIFMLLYYRLYKENEENLKIIYKILEYLIYEKEIIKKDESILQEIKSQFNDRLMITLFETSIDNLILIIKELQFNDINFTNDFNFHFIQKLHTYCDENKTKINKIKLIKLIYGILEIIDEYSKKRIETLLGYPTLIIRKNKDNIIPLFGVKIMNDNINNEIFEYISPNHISKERCILSILFPSNYEENKDDVLEENDRLDLIYELIKTSLGFNKRNMGNYFLFKYLYLMQSRSIKYDNLYQEIKEILENVNKKNNNKYDLQKLKNNELKCIDLIKYEKENLEHIINLACKIKSLEIYNKKKFNSKPELPECFKSCIENEKIIKDYYGLTCNIIPDNIGKIYINLIASNNKLNIIRFEYYTTYFKRKELLTLSDEKKEFRDENVKRDKDKDSEETLSNGNEIEYLDFSIFKDKKDEKDFIIYINSILNDNKDIIIENKEISDNKVLKNCLIRYYALTKIKSIVIRIDLIKNELAKDIENNFYIPYNIYDCVEKQDCNNIINTHRLNYEYRFLKSDSIGTSIKIINYENYFKEYIKNN